MEKEYCWYHEFKVFYDRQLKTWILFIYNTYYDISRYYAKQLINCIKVLNKQLKRKDII